MIKLVDYENAVREFELYSLYYVYFRINTLWKGMKPFTPPAMG